MRHYIGLLLQVVVLAALPMISFWQLQNGFPLIWMPALLTAGIGIFWLGARLRES